MKFICHNRNYTSWNLDGKNFFYTDPHDICPLTHKLLTGDIINNTGEIISSPYRDKQYIPGVLKLHEDTYDKADNGKYYYKCFPDDTTLPIFLIPYKPHISKNIVNKFIIFKFNNWSDKQPCGTIVNVIGDVDSTLPFYEYEMIRKNLPTAPGINNLKEILKSMRTRTSEMVTNDIFYSKLYKVQLCKDDNVFTIDSPGCKSIDRALSIDTYGKFTKINVFIANVPLWLDALDLWKMIDNKCASMYLPDRVIPMLHSTLSTYLCSLIKGCDKPVFVMELYILDYEIIDIRFKNSIIFINENYHYEEPDLLSNTDYIRLLSFTKYINNKNKYLEQIKDSRDVVSYYMILMNHMVAKELISVSLGIYRTSKEYYNTVKRYKISPEVQECFDNWNGSGDKYVKYNRSLGYNSISNRIDHYLHVTSPIGRIIDIVNLVEIQKLIDTEFRISCQQFINKTYDNLTEINVIMKNISRVQSDCILYNAFIANNNYQSIIYEGITMEVGEKSGYSDKIKYTIFLAELKLIFNIYLSKSLELYSKHKYSIHVFNGEFTLRKKVNMIYIF
tara:strand:+ start:2807 stop:4486 length:1680 start_codon:yes stop_codon:yes gene_type:complete